MIGVLVVVTVSLLLSNALEWYLTANPARIPPILGAKKYAND